MRRQIAAGNWKMNTDLKFGQEFIENIEKQAFPEDVEVIIGVPYLSISQLAHISSKVKIAAQNCHQEDKGAYTGEIAANMLNSVGCDYVILGHSERRQYFNESDELILSKIYKVLENDMQVIYCCGEPLEVREADKHEAYVGQQLSESICKLDPSHMKNLVVAYEPIWAIGTGRTASPEQAQSMHAHIRNVLKTTFGEDIANATSILYGGSVKPANAKEIFSQADVDGGLVGGASLKGDSFYDIIQSF